MKPNRKISMCTFFSYPFYLRFRVGQPKNPASLSLQECNTTGICFRICKVEWTSPLSGNSSMQKMKVWQAKWIEKDFQPPLSVVPSQAITSTMEGFYISAFISTGRFFQGCESKTSS